MTLTMISGLVLVIVAVCQGVKYAGVSSRYIPILAIVLGIAGAVYLAGADWLEVASGVIAGLTSSGLYSGLKKTIINS